MTVYVIDPAGREWEDRDAESRDEPPSPVADTSPAVAARAEVLLAKLLTVDAMARLPAPSWLVQGVLFRNSLAVLYGAPGSGKSFVALDWALSVATGAWWFNRPVPPLDAPDVGPVLFIAGEGSPGMSARVEAWKKDRGIWEIEEYLRFLPLATNLLDPLDGPATVAMCDFLNPCLIVIDTLSRSMAGGDENSAKDMSRLIAVTDEMRARTGACVLLLHHNSRAGGNPRGSSALEGAADTVIYCDADGDNITLYNDPPKGKQKDAEPFAPIQLTRVQTGDSCVLTKRTIGGDEVSQSAAEMLTALAEIDTGEGVSHARWKESTTVAPRTFNRWVKKLLDAGFSANTGTAKAPRYTITEQGKGLVR